jgi:adenylylsulfate kinase
MSKIPDASPAACYWLTGLSGAGKSTLARHIHQELQSNGVRAVILDGDVLREGLNSNLGFSREDRRENVRRIAEVAKLMVDAGLVVLVSVISPYAEDRAKARGRFDPDTFFEVYVSTDFETCARRDIKGLYAKARSGEVRQFTGLNDPYEPPVAADFEIPTAGRSVAEAADPIVRSVMLRVCV